MFWQKHSIEKKDLLIPASVLIGSVLISVSIFLSTGKGIEIGPKPAAPAQAAAAGAKVEVSERAGAATLGSGKVEIVEFSDFQCPFCQRFYNSAYQEIKDKYIDTGKVKFVYRHFPLQSHPDAQKAAEAAECAGKQGQFFPYHDLLFTKLQPNGGGLSVPELKQYARDLGLDAGRFNSCLDNGETAGIVKADLDEARKIGVSGTPSFFINGEKVSGAQPFAAFEAVIERALKQ